MIARLFVLSLAIAVTPAFATQRSNSAKAAFKREQPCPATLTRKGPCPGYVIDHVIPLCAGGADTHHNMQWQTTEAAKAKDRDEWATCRKLRAVMRDTQPQK